MSQHDQISQPGSRILARCTVYGLLTLLVVGLAASAWLVLESRRPEPGANMALMGLPMIGLPTGLVALTLLVATLFMGPRLLRAERIALGAIALLAFAAFAMLFVLG